MLNPELLNFTYHTKNISQILETNNLLFDKEFSFDINNPSLQNQSHFIESLLLRMPIHMNFLVCLTNDNLIIYDGFHKINCIFSYFNNEFALDRLEYLDKYNDKYYEDLPKNIQRRLLETNLTLINIKHDTPYEVKHNIIERVNNIFNK